MSGKKPIGRPIGRRQSELARSKIQTTKLIQRLQNHALGKEEMAQTEITAAQFLLRQNLAPLQAIDLDSGSTEVKTRTVIKIGD